MLKDKTIYRKVKTGKAFLSPQIKEKTGLTQKKTRKKERKKKEKWRLELKIIGIKFKKLLFVITNAN